MREKWGGKRREDKEEECNVGRRKEMKGRRREREIN